MLTRSVTARIAAPSLGQCCRVARRRNWSPERNSTRFGVANLSACSERFDRHGAGLDRLAMRLERPKPTVRHMYAACCALRREGTDVRNGISEVWDLKGRFHGRVVPEDFL